MVWNPKIKLIEGEIHKYWLREAYQCAKQYSEDTITNAGALIVTPDLEKLIAFGANHFPKGLNPTKEQIEDRNWKYQHIIHAETAAVHYAAVAENFELHNPTTKGAVMYMPWVPCTNCAKSIIDCGIKKLIGHKELIMKTPERWHKDTDYALQLLDMCGVERFMYEGKIGNVSNLFNSEIWEP